MENQSLFVFSDIKKGGRMKDRKNILIYEKS